LSDSETRRRFDVGEIDAQGHERPKRQFYCHYAEQGAGRRYDPHPGVGGFDNESDLFGRRKGGGPQYRQEFHALGPDLRYTLEIDFLDAATGVKKSVTMPDGNRIEISFPPGT
jgi:DnaJ-class molecular chaperone